jgi:diphthamide synthase (EF-2-diphthine--ammonia ligase)
MDCALALWTLRKQGRERRALLTTSSEPSARVSHHDVCRELLARQAEEAGVELVDILIPPPCSKEEYEHRLERALAETILISAQTAAGRRAVRRPARSPTYPR